MLIKIVFSPLRKLFIWNAQTNLVLLLVYIPYSLEQVSYDVEDLVTSLQREFLCLVCFEQSCFASEKVLTPEILISNYSA